MKEEPSALLRYSLPVLANALALLGAVLLGLPMQEARAPLFFAAVAVSAWYGGLGPGMLSIILAVASLRLFLPSSQTPANAFAGVVAPVIFTLAAFLIAYLQAGRRRAGSDALEKRLADENQFRKAIEESMRAGVAVIDLEGRQTYVNRAFCEMVGWSEEELIGSMPPYPYWAPEELDRIYEAFGETIAGRANPSGLELLLRRRNEERFHAVVLPSPLKNARGEIGGWLASVYDLTERKRIEQELELLLAREQKAREEAELAYHARDEFIAMVSHELRNPLNSMLGWLHIVRTRRPDEATTARAIEAIENNAKMQARLINDLLDLSRISSGKIHLKISDLDLAQAVEIALQQVRPSADEKNISIETSLETCMVLGDSDRLAQVMQNILSNAVKFTPRGGVIAVDLQRHAASAQVTIKDNGSGIDQSLLPHIFDKFRQGEPGKERGGLGLGLTIVRDLIEMHGGSVRAESGGEGCGAVFTITLPLSPNIEG